MTPRWSAHRPTHEAWRSLPGMSPADRSLEQDQAAGGHDARIVALADGRSALASVALRQYRNTRRVYAYLRWSDLGTTRERYIGEVTARSRAENLAQAWRIVAERGMTGD